MSALSIACRLVLAGVFAFSGSAKLFARDAFAGALEAFRVPASLRTIVPVVELGVAVVLVVGLRRSEPAGAAVVILVAFTIAIVRNLVAGVRAPCPCFGAVGHDELSAGTVVRNGWLLALAIIGTGEAPSAGVPAVVLMTLGLGAISAIVIWKLV